MAEKIIANLTLDTYQRNKIPPLVIPQHDYGARYIRVRITEQGENVSVASGSVVSIIAKRMADGSSAAFSGSVNADGSVLVPVTQWMLDAPSDDVDCHVAVTGTGYQYSTTSFVISPQERENPSYLEEDDPRVNIVEEALIKVVEEADRAEEQADLAQSAASTAASDAKEAARQEVEQLVGQLGIVQSLGNSRMAVVSQAVTTGLYNRNAKRISNLEQGFNEQFETDSSVAYVKDVPEGALPYAEVKKVGGVTYKDGNTLTSAKVTEVESVGANVFNIDNRKQGYGNTEGDLVIDGNSNLFYEYPFKPSTQYTLSAYVKNINTTGNVRLAVKYTDGTSDNVVLLNSTTDYQYKEHTTQPNKTIEGIYADYSSSGSMFIKGGVLMINEGTVALPYIPYAKHTLPIPEAVQAIDDYGLGVSDTVYNYIDWEKKQFVKKCVSVDLGTLDFGMTGTRVCLGYGLVGVAKPNIGLCDKYIVIPETPIENSADKTLQIRNDIMYIKDSSLTDPSQVTGTLIYELATPEVTDISDLISADNFIGVEGHGTLTFKNAYEYAVPSEVEYQVEV